MKTQGWRPLNHYGYTDGPQRGRPTLRLEAERTQTCVKAQINSNTLNTVHVRWNASLAAISEWKFTCTVNHIIFLLLKAFFWEVPHSAFLYRLSLFPARPLGSMTVVADRASFHIIKFDCPLFSSEMCGRDSIKVYSFSCMRSIAAGTQWRIYYFEEREVGARKHGSRHFYFPSNNLMGLNYIIDFNSSRPCTFFLILCLPFCFSVSSFCPLSVPRGTHVVILAVSEGSVAWQHSSLLPPHRPRMQQEEKMKYV